VFYGNSLSLKSGGAYSSVNTVLRVQIESIHGYAAMEIISRRQTQNGIVANNGGDCTSNMQ